MKKLFLLSATAAIVAGCGGGSSSDTSGAKELKPINPPVNKEYKSYEIRDIHVKSNNYRTIIIWREFKEEKGCAANSYDCTYSALYKADKLNGSWNLPKKEQDAVKSWDHVNNSWLPGSSDIALFRDETAVILATEIVTKKVNGTNKSNSRVSMFLYNNGTWKPENYIDAYGSFNMLPKVAMDKNGNALALWIAAGNLNYYKLYSAQYINGHWSIPVNLNDNIGAANGGNIPPYISPLVTFKNGHGFAVWVQEQTDNSNKYYIYGGDYFVKNNPMWLIKDNSHYLSYNSNFSDGIDIAMDTSGNKLLVWANYDINSKKMHIYTNKYCSNSWHKPLTMDDFIDINSAQEENPMGFLSDRISADMNDNGFSIIAWSQQTNNGKTIYTIRYYGDSCLMVSSDNTKAISPSTGTDALYPKVALNNNAQAVLAWIQKYNGKKRLYIAKFNNGSWQKPAAENYLGTENVNGYDIALNDNGEITVVWSEKADNSHSYLYKKEMKID